MDERVFGGRYRIKEKIGAGGMAEVFKAFDTTLDRTVAVKILHPQYAGEENFVARFRREARAAANLNQPNIVNIYDWGSENNTYFLVMEYLVGKNLKQIISEKGPLPASSAIDIGQRIATALQSAHKHQIVHRDIKPHNIFITDEGEVKVTDFGIARSSASNATQTGDILGTAHYLSPEQARGEEVSAASDIYSLGVVMYEMLTAQVPFSGDSPVAVALKHVQEKPRPPREINKDIPTDLEIIVLRAMAKNPANRYGSATALRDDLSRCAQGRPVNKSFDEDEADQTIVLPRLARSREPASKRGGGRAARKLGFALFIILLFTGSALATNFFLGRMARNEVPSLSGETVSEARKLLAREKLKLQISARVFDSKVDAGKIIDQKPPPGEKLLAGGIVSVRISKGKDLITMPDLTNKFLNSAMRTLSKLDLSVGGIQEDFNDTIADDYIISHDPPANTKVTKGTDIKLLVSKGSRPLKVPYLINKTATEARQVLSSMGLVIDKEEEYDDEVEADRVIRQDPAQGVSIEKGGNVTVWVSRGPLLITVPSVIGLDEEEAKSKLQDAGFKTQVRDGISAAELYGKVVTQRPEGDSSARKKTTVTIWVGEREEIEE